jgi:hypothetical protein
MVECELRDVETPSVSKSRPYGDCQASLRDLPCCKYERLEDEAIKLTYQTSDT